MFSIGKITILNSESKNCKSAFSIVRERMWIEKQVQELWSSRIWHVLRIYHHNECWGVEFLLFWPIRTIFRWKITIFQVRPPIAPCWWSKSFRTWKLRFFGNYPVLIDFSWHFYDFCRVPIEDFQKNHDSEQDFDDQHEVNGRKRCWVFVVLTDPDDFQMKNHDFSGAAANCPALVIEVV